VLALTKPYGRSYIVVEHDGLGIALMQMLPGQTSSYHDHRLRRELVWVRSGRVDRPDEPRWGEQDLQSGAGVRTAHPATDRRWQGTWRRRGSGSGRRGRCRGEAWKAAV